MLEFITMALCTACSSIDAEFFAPTGNEFQDRKVTHLPINRIKESAASGCPMCVCLSASLRIRDSTKDVLKTTPVTLIRPYDIVQLVISVGAENLPGPFFSSSIPSEWGV